MKQSTKTLLIICAVCLVLGIGCVTIGFLKGPSIWAYWDGKAFITSNAAGTYSEKKELEPFSSIEVSILTGNCTIQEGDRYSIDYKSCLPGVTPELRIEEGKLLLTADMEDSTVIPLVGSETMFRRDNYITITIPRGTKLDSIQLGQSINWRQIGLPLFQNCNLENIKAGTLFSFEEDYLDFTLSLTDCQFDAISLYNSTSVTAKNVTAGQMKFINDENTIWWYAYGNSLKLENVTADLLEKSSNYYDREMLFNPEKRKFAYNQRSEQGGTFLANCNIGTVDVMDYTITAKKLTANSITLLAQGDMTVSQCDFGPETILRANKLTLETGEKREAFSGLLSAGSGYQAGLVTAYADYGTPEYDHGYVTDAVKAFGTRKVLITEEQYEYLMNLNGNQYTGSNAYTTVEGNGDDVPSIYQGEYAKFKDYVDVGSSYYDDETNETTYEMVVYNRKLTTYYTNHAGERVYVDLSGSADDVFLSVDETLQESMRMQLTGSGKSLDAYASKSMKVNFGK